MKTKSKRLVVLFVLCSILLLVPSCQKKTEAPVEAAKTEESTVQSAVQTAQETVVVKAEEPSPAVESEEKKVEEDVQVAAVPAEAPAEPVIESGKEESVLIEAEEAPLVEETVELTSSEVVPVVETSPAESPYEEIAEVAEEAEVVTVISVTEEKSDDLVYEDTLSYKGLTTTLKVATTEAEITLPEGMGLEDVQACASLINAAFPQEASLVSYSLDGDTLTLKYPEQTQSFLCSAVDTLRAEAMALLDSYSFEKESEVEEVPVVEEDTPVADEISNVSDSAVYSDTLTYNGITSSVTVYNDHALVTIPQGMEAGDVFAVAEMVRKAYPSEAELVYFSLEDDVLSLFYPRQDDEFLLAVIDVLRSEAMALIDTYAPAVEEKAEETAESVTVITSSSEEDSFIFVLSYSYKGYESDIIVTGTSASLTIPEFVSEDDIRAVASIVAERYSSEASLISYEIAGDTLILHYPEQSADYIASALGVVEEGARAVIDMYPLTVEKEEEVVIADSAVPLVESETQNDEVSSGIAALTEEAPVVQEEEKEEEALALSEPLDTSYSDNESVTVVADVQTVEVEAGEEEKAPVQTLLPHVTASSLQKEEKESIYKGFSIAAYVVPKWNFTEGWSSPFDFAAGLRAEAKIKSFALGVKVHYDFSVNILTEAYARWNFCSLKNWDFYALVAGGGLFGVGPNTGKISFVGEIGLGADWNILSSFSLFGEITGQWSPYGTGIEAGLTVGAKFTF